MWEAIIGCFKALFGSKGITQIGKGNQTVSGSSTGDNSPVVTAGRDVHFNVSSPVPSPTLGEVKAFFHKLTREAHRLNDQNDASNKETWADNVRAQIEDALIGAKLHLFKSDFPRTFQGVRQWLFADSQNLKDEHINPNFRIPTL